MKGRNVKYHTKKHASLAIEREWEWELSHIIDLAIAYIQSGRHVLINGPVCYPLLLRGP